MAATGGPGRDARSIHSPHLFHDVKEAVELGEHALTFGRCQLKPRQVGNAADVLGVSAMGKIKKPDVKL